MSEEEREPPFWNTREREIWNRNRQNQEDAEVSARWNEDAQRAADALVVNDALSAVVENRLPADTDMRIVVRALAREIMILRARVEKLEGER